MAATLEITGNVREKFVRVAALLHLLDPVRGEPTAYSLDQDSNSAQLPRDTFLKRKFLDSFALICATKKDGDSVSAVCLEENGHAGTTIRIASNAGVSEDTMNCLREILGLISSVTRLDPADKELEVLRCIIRLDMAKIQKYIKAIKKSNRFFDESVTELRSRVGHVTQVPPSSPQRFLHWFEHFASIRDLQVEPTASLLLSHILWARDAKNLYYSYLDAAFSTDGYLPVWVNSIFKLGRYGIAARALIQTSAELPDLFNPIVVESVTAPSNVPFVLREDKTLATILRRVPSIDIEDTMSRLARIWKTDNPEARIRDHCSVNLTTHAEMQLVNYYDHNPHLLPPFRFIGVSKKSCYLCSMFLEAHPSKFSVSSCHQKLYLSWIPSPATDPEVYKQNKTLIGDMSQKMEAIARQDLVSRLDLRRFPIPADSTAGVSISGLIALRSVATTDFAEHKEIEIDTISYAETDNCHMRSLPEIFTPPSTDSPSISVNEMSSIDTKRQLLGLVSPKSVSSMVLHFKCLGDEIRQDIIMVASMLDPDTQNPSWSKLVELLNSGDRFGLVFKNSDFLIFDNKIRVRNERQLTACLQYILNSGARNSDVLVCDSNSSDKNILA